MKKQRGVLIVALMAGIAIVMILTTVAFQQWTDIARRDAEAEMMFRAQDIVRALTPDAGKFDKHDEYFESEGYIVTSAVGHLLEIKAPEEFDVKRGKWSFAHLPVIPPPFDLAPLAVLAQHLPGENEFGPVHQGIEARGAHAGRMEIRESDEDEANERARKRTAMMMSNFLARHAPRLADHHGAATPHAS